MVRWEKETSTSLRSGEFRGEEGHTAHAAAEEAEEDNGYVVDEKTIVYSKDELYSKLGAEVSGDDGDYPEEEYPAEEEYSEEEYLEARDEKRGEEINRILTFLGY